MGSVTRVLVAVVLMEMVNKLLRFRESGRVIGVAYDEAGYFITSVSLQLRRDIRDLEFLGWVMISVSLQLLAHELVEDSEIGVIFVSLVPQRTLEGIGLCGSGAETLAARV